MVLLCISQSCFINLRPRILSDPYHLILNYDRLNCLVDLRDNARYFDAPIPGAYMCEGTTFGDTLLILTILSNLPAFALRATRMRSLRTHISVINRLRDLERRLAWRAYICWGDIWSYMSQVVGSIRFSRA